MNPRLTLIVKPGDADVVKLMAGRAFRAPSIYELYYNDGGISQVPACAAGVTGLAVPLVQRALTAMTRISVEGPRWDRNAAASDPPQGRTGAAVLWDLVLSGDLPEWHARYSLGVYNLADWKYEVPVSPEFAPLLTAPQSGRSVVSSLTLSL